MNYSTHHPYTCAHLMREKNKKTKKSCVVCGLATIIRRIFHLINILRINLLQIINFISSHQLNLLKSGDFM